MQMFTRRLVFVKEKALKIKPIFWLLLFFFLIYSVGVMVKFGSMTFVPDEAHVVFSVLKFFRDWSFADPFAYAFPVNTLMYLPFIAFTFVFMFISGIVSSVSELQSIVLLNPEYFVPVFRFVSIIFSLVSLYLWYKISHKVLASEKWALVSTYLLGTSFVFIKISFIALKWMPQLLLVFIALYFFLKLYEKEKLEVKHYFYIALLVALNYGVALVGAVVIVPALYVIYKMRKEGRAPNVLKGLLAGAGTLAVLLPLITLASPTLARNTFMFVQETAVTGSAEPLRSSLASFRYWGYLDVLFKAEPLLLLLGAIGSVVIYVKNRTAFYFFFSYFALYYIVLGPIMNSIRQRRTVLIVPILALFSAYLFKTFHEKYGGRTMLLKGFIGIVLLVFLFNPFIIRHELKKANSKQLAKSWVERTIEPGAVIHDECLLELSESKEKVIYIRDNFPSLHTSKQRALLSTPEQFNDGVRYFVTANSAVSQKDIFPQDGEHYFVFCYGAIPDSEEYAAELKDRIGIMKLSRVYDSFTLETIYDSAQLNGLETSRSRYLLNTVDVRYLLERFGETDYQDHVEIFRIIR